MPAWLAAVYCVTFLGPLYHSVRGLWRDRDRAWLWHLAACPCSVFGTLLGIWTYRTRRGDRRLVADLQVKQRLKK